MSTDRNDEWTDTEMSVIEELRTQERLEGVEGLERSLVAQAAERSERQGEAEGRSREGRRVAPETEEAVRDLLAVIDGEAARLHRNAALYEHWGKFSEMREPRREAARREGWARAVRSLLPTTASSALCPDARPDEESSTEAPADAPTGDTRSGRRNDQSHRTASHES